MECLRPGAEAAASGRGIGHPCAQVQDSRQPNRNNDKVCALGLVTPNQRPHFMDESLNSSSARRSIFPWVIVVIVICAAAGSAFWMNQKIEALQAATAPRQEVSVDETRQALVAVQQTTKDIQTGQQKLTEQVNELQRRIAGEQGE